MSCEVATRPASRIKDCDDEGASSDGESCDGGKKGMCLVALKK